MTDLEVLDRTAAILREHPSRRLTYALAQASGTDRRAFWSVFRLLRMAVPTEHLATWATGVSCDEILAVVERAKELLSEGAS